MARTWAIVDNGIEDQLIVTETDGTKRSVGRELENDDFMEFLLWNAEEAEPLTLPETWPTLPE